LRKLLEHSEILTDVLQAANLNPRSAVVLINLGLARQRAGYLEGAKNAYEAALRLDPTAISAALSLCEVYDELELNSEAMRLRWQLLNSITALQTERRKALMDEELDVRRGLAFGLTNAGNISAAVQVLSEGFAIDPRLAILHALVHIPHVPGSLQEIMDSRLKTMAALEVILSTRQPQLMPGDSIEVIGDMGYYLTYNGMNDEEFRRKIAAVHAVVYPHLTAFPPPVVPGHRDLLSDAQGAVSIPPRLSRRYASPMGSQHFLRQLTCVCSGSVLGSSWPTFTCIPSAK
jgi:tetratricopeptide (TPR) repeat protein